MPDWTKSMEQTYEYHIVDPSSWRDKSKIEGAISCRITRDSEAETLGSATIDMHDSVGECYIRAYLVTIQNGVRERFPLATFLVQTPSTNFNGKVKTISMDCYTPLLELKENPPPLGYSILKGENIMDNAYRIVRENVRAPVVPAVCTDNLYFNFVANTDDKWLSFTRDLIANAKYHFDLDEMGRILFAPNQDTASLQPVWTYNDDNSSILYADISVDRDLYDIPNVVEVLYSSGVNSYYARVVNDDPNSPTSTISRGREIVRRVADPQLTGNATQARIEEYANNLLRELSTLEYTVTYTHGYCPVRVGDCIRLNYSRADLKDIKAKVIKQDIECVPGCKVTETAVFTNNLWG